MNLIDDLYDEIERVEKNVVTSKKYILMNNSVVTYIHNFVNPFDSKKIFDDLFTNVDWVQGTYNMYGRIVLTPRLLSAMRDANDDIRDVYKITDSVEWTPLVYELKRSLEILIGRKLRYAQLNYYRSGSDYIGFHTDSEVGSSGLIVSVSLGATRRFVLQYKSDPKKKFELDLFDGSVLIMNVAAAKTHWKHSIPRAKMSDPRINLTFRDS